MSEDKSAQVKAVPKNIPASFLNVEKQPSVSSARKFDLLAGSTLFESELSLGEIIAMQDKAIKPTRMNEAASAKSTKR